MTMLYCVGCLTKHFPINDRLVLANLPSYHQSSIKIIIHHSIEIPPDVGMTNFSYLHFVIQSAAKDPFKIYYTFKNILFL